MVNTKAMASPRFLLVLFAMILLAVTSVKGRPDGSPMAAPATAPSSAGGQYIHDYYIAKIKHCIQLRERSPTDEREQYAADCICAIMRDIAAPHGGASRMEGSGAPGVVMHQELTASASIAVIAGRLEEFVQMLMAMITGDLGLAI